MKSLREQFEADYAAISVPAGNGTGFKMRYVYYAPWYLWDMPEPVLKKKKWLLASASAISLLILLITGTRKNGMNSYLPVELTGTLALCAYVPESFSMIRFLIAKYKTSRMTYFSIDRTLRIIPLIRGFCLVQATVWGIYYMVQNMFNLDTVLVTIGYLICAAMALYIVREYSRIPLGTKKNDLLEEER